MAIKHLVSRDKYFSHSTCISSPKVDQFLAIEHSLLPSVFVSRIISHLQYCDCSCEIFILFNLDLFAYKLEPYFDIELRYIG